MWNIRNKRRRFPHGVILKPTLLQKICLYLTGRRHTREQETALLRWHAGPDAERDNERAGRPRP